MESVTEARQASERFVKPLGRRWDHVQAVASRAQELGDAVAEPERSTLVAAAWLHDIGYSPEIGHTRFHPLDGARYLKASGWSEVVVNLVAHHSGARFEAEQRGIADQLSEFPFRDTALLDALVTADLTVGPGGEQVSYDERISEILSRYPASDPVHRAWLVAAPVMRAAVERTQRRLDAAQPR
ncbi:MULTISPECIES: HD domain-containing protein [Amycolatopsis]|uniref:HD domain-containing protein n=1 Tax=Amycolatopsis TaxID=1813 RepID=UPI00082E4BD3|nr:HD domain-containing protein [Amycolatopsis sp. M39]